MDVHGDSILVKMFISLKIQNPGLQLYPHNKMFHKWNVDLVTEYSSSVSKFQTVQFLQET